MRQLLLAIALSLAAFGLASRAAGNGDSDPAAALLAIRDADPLELWRVARRVGDAPILALLDARQPAGVRLAAARSAPYLVEPELALLPLCALLTTRDSDLAPAAGRSILQIARALDALSLARRELAPTALVPALQALDRAVAQRALRADLALMAAAAAAQLRAAGAFVPIGK